MGYDISGVKNKERQREKLSADCGWKPAWEQTDKNKAAINILKGKDEVESLDFSNVLAEGKYNTLSSKAEAYLSYKADSDVNAAGAKEVSLATSADNAKDGNFVNSVITDEDVWEGTIKFEKYEDGVYKVVKVDKDGNRVVMGYADEKSKQNFYHGAAQEVKNSVKDGSGVDKSGNNSSKSTNTNISDGDSDSNEVSKDNKSTKKKGIDDTEVSGNGTTTSGGNNNNNSNLSGSDNSSNNSSVAAQKSAKELSAEIAAARENLSKAAKISDKITVSEKKLGTLLEKMQTENLSTDDLKEVKKYYKDIYKSYKNTLKQREDDLKNGDLSKEEKKVCKNDIKILEEACSFFKSKYYTVEYDNDMKNQEAVNYNSNIEIDNDALEKSMEKVSLPSGVHYQYDYKKYCELVGKDKAVSPLDFYKAVKKKEGECSNIPETYWGDTGNTDLLKRISDTDKSLSTISKANGNDSSISVYSNLYNYYYYTQGAEAAEKYAIKMKEQFNSINGTAEALEKNNMLTDDLNSGKGGKLAAQIHALFDKMTYGAGNVGTGAVNAIKAIAGGKDQEVQTQKDFEKEYFSQLLNERGSDFAFINKYGETLGEMATYSVLAALTGPLTAAGGGAAAAGEAATTASSSGAIASVTNFASKGINSKLALASFQGLTTFGNLYHSTRVEGNDHESSLNYAAISGVSSTVLEYLIGGIGILGKNAGNAALKASGFAAALENSGIKNALVKVGSSVGFNLGKEALQEGLQEGAETALDTLALRKKFLDEESSWEDVKANIKEAIISGGIISLIMNTSHVTSNLTLGAVEAHDNRSSRVRSDTNVESSNSIEKIKELQSDYDGKSREYDKKKAEFDAYEKKLDEEGISYTDRYADENYMKKADELQQAKNELELSKKKLEDVELEEQNNIQKKDNSDAKQSESVSSLRSLQRISYEEIKDMNSNQIRKKFLKDVPILSDSALVKKFANIFAKKGRIDYKDLVYTENKKPPTKEAIAAYDDYFSSPEIRQKLTQYDQDQGGYLRHYYTKEYPGFDKGINNRFYLNLEGNDVLKFNKLFVEECLSENLPFYFKSGVYSKKYFDTHKEICSPKLLKRSDSVIIYCMKEDCGDMFRIIKKIQNENPDISFLEPPLATGKVDVGIGYGFEMKYTSYNDRKAEEISGVLERVSKAFKEKYGNSNLETINEHFDDYLKMVNKKANELNCNSYLSEDDKELLSLSAAGDKSSVVGDKSNAVADIIANKLVMQKIKLNNGKRFSSPSELLDYVCRSMGDVGAERLYELYGKVTKKGKLDYDDWMFITDKNNSREAVMSLYASSPTLNHFCNYIGTFLENYSSNTSNKKFIDNRNYNIGETERFFEKYRASDGTIGVDQGVIKGLVVYADSKGNEYSYQQVLAMCAAARKQGKPLPHFKTRIGNTEYFYLKNKLESLGFNYIDSQVILDSIDVGFGACTDAATGDAILNKFKSNPELFQKTFGYSMYKKDKGKLKLNSSELLLDLYLFANDKKNGGNLFYTSADGKKNIDPMYISYNVDSLGRDILDGKKKRNFFGSYLAADEMTNNFLKSKSSKFEYYGDYIFRNLQETNRKSLNSLELDNVIKKVDSAINKGKSVTIGVCSDEKNPVKFIPLDKNRAIVKASKTEWGEGAGHEVCIIGKNKDGFIVSSWGGKYLISFDDLSHGRIDIHSSDIKLI